MIRIAWLFSLLLFAAPVAAQQVTTLAAFDGSNGQYPVAAPIIDAEGSLLGTTGGAPGVIYRMRAAGDGYAAPEVLGRLEGELAGVPRAALLQDAAGNLIGTALAPGANAGHGMIFLLPPIADGYGPPRLVARFTGADGSVPNAGLIADAAGTLYGATYSGGAHGQGVIYALRRTAEGYGPITPLAHLDGKVGAGPMGRLLLDAAGNLLGTAYAGGPTGHGSVFLLPRQGDGFGPPEMLAGFDEANGEMPLAGLTADAAGNLYGTTQQGGKRDEGVVFTLAKTATGYGPLAVVDSFEAGDGRNPQAPLTLGPDGALYTVSQYGGIGDGGALFRLTPDGPGYGPLEPLVWFEPPLGTGPQGGVVVDAAGRLIGTTTHGGAASLGTVFRVVVQQRRR